MDRRVWLECQALVAEGVTVSVICPKADGDPRFEHLEGVDLWKYRPAPATDSIVSFLVEFVWSWLATAWLSLRAARRRGFDVIQACNPPDTFWLLALMWRPFGKRFVFDQHDLCPELYESRFGSRGPAYWGLRGLERATYRVADEVVSTNESYRAVAERRGKVDPDHLTIVRTGPDPERLRRVDADPSLRHGRRHLCAYVGVMGPQDGVDLAVRAAAHVVHTLGRDDVQFGLVGSGDSFESLQKLVAELDLTDFVDMPGRVSDEVLRSYLSTADLGLCPDPRNPLNDVSTMNKTMEYMALGLPVVSFDLIETRVSAQDAAVYATPNDPAEFGDAIIELLDDPGRREQMGKYGKQRVSDVLAWEHQVGNYVEVYRRLLG